MRLLQTYMLAAFLALSLAQAAFADSITLKNGDRFTGTITAIDKTEIALKTDAAGDVKIKWSAVQQLSSDKPLYVATPERTTITGTVTSDGHDFIVHTTTSGDVTIPVTQITVVRTESDQKAYEKSLHPGLLSDWTGAVNIGFALARGNSDTTNLNTAFAADRKTLADEFKLTASSIYSTSGTSTTGAPGGVTANEILGDVAYDRNIGKRIFVFASGDFTHDELQDLILRAIYTGGLGWHAINTPNTTLDALLGINYTRESYSTSASTTTPSTSVDRNLPGITAGENFMHKFGANTVFAETFDFYPDLSDINQYRFSLDAAVVTKIKKWLGWQTSLSDRFVTNPPIAGTKSNDVILSTGFNISFAH
ncbi:MAG TPA: DUF481 domain-containing protein [Candidatus Acidoferrales bacterium]|nr:DUF481 domain-containing protein [Candidatus Acidoferrales bacterium]